MLDSLLCAHPVADLFRGENCLRDWTSKPELHPVTFLLEEEGVLISRLEVVWDVLVHAGEMYRTYGLSGATLTPNKSGFIPRIVNGRPVKSIDQGYNKERARLQGALAKMDGKRPTSHRLDRLTNKRTRQIDHYLHVASRHIIDLLIAEEIGLLIIGYNPERNNSGDRAGIAI